MEAEESQRRRPQQRKQRRYGPRQVVIPENPTVEEREALLSRAFNTALWHIERGPKTGAQIAEKLRRKAFTDEYINVTIAKLEDLHLINDEQFAHNYVAIRAHSKGASVLRQEMRRKGVPDEFIQDALEENIDPDEQEQAARNLAARRISSLPEDLEDQKKISRVTGALLRRGFPPGIVFRVVKEELAAAKEALEGAEDY